MTRKTWNFLELGAAPRMWAEVLIILFILSVGFFSMQVLLAYVAPLPPCGPGAPTDHCAPQSHPATEMRWDQGYLNEYSRMPCPAVYDAPNGNLRECL